MNKMKSFEEEELLPSSLLEDESFDSQNILNNVNSKYSRLESKSQNLENNFLVSNFSNPKNMVSKFREVISEEANDIFKEKEEPNYQNLDNLYLLYSNIPKNLSENILNNLNENQEKKWSQINIVPNNEKETSKLNTPNINLNKWKTEDIYMNYDREKVQLNKLFNNGFEGTLNIFTKNLSNIKYNNIKCSNKYGETNNGNNSPEFGKNKNQSNEFLKKSLINIENGLSNNLNCINLGDSHVNNINYDNFSGKINNNSTFFDLSLFDENKCKNDASNNDKDSTIIDKPFYGVQNIDSNENKKFYNLLNNFNQKIKENKSIEEEKPQMKRNIEEEKDIYKFKRFCNELSINLPDYICSRVGSKEIQNYLINTRNPLKTKYLISKICTYFERIICDKFGNYFFQKLYLISSKLQRRKILYYMKDYFVKVSKDETGVHVIQRIIEEVQTIEEKNIIMSYIKGNEIEMSLDNEGTHIIQKIIQLFSENERQDLTDKLCIPQNIDRLLCSLNGVHVLKRIIYFNKEKCNKTKLIEALLPNIYSFLQSYNGSYILCYLFEQWGIDIGIKIVDIIISNFEFFATKKNSVNAICKILQICINKIILSVHYNNSNLSILNYYNEILIMKTLKAFLFEPNKIEKIYQDKYGKLLVIKIRALLSMEENKLLYLFVESLKNSPCYCLNKQYRIYLEIFNSI